MSKVTSNLIKNALRNERFALAVKLAILAETRNGWANLDNAYGYVSSALTKQQWAAYIGVLAKAGEYEANQDEDFAGFYGKIVHKSEE